MLPFLQTNPENHFDYTLSKTYSHDAVPTGFLLKGIENEWMHRCSIV